jgi:hypothetical protein
VLQKPLGMLRRGIRNRQGTIRFSGQKWLGSALGHQTGVCNRKPNPHVPTSMTANSSLKLQCAVDADTWRRHKGCYFCAAITEHQLDYK